MVLGILAVGIGAVVAGVGIFRGSSKLGKAAESTADHIGNALESIAGDLTDLKTYVIKEMGPTITETLLQLQQLLGQFKVLATRAEELIITGTFAIKILAVTLLLSCALICKYIASETERGYVRLAAFHRRRSIALKTEKIVLCLLYYLFLCMAIVIALHLVEDVSQFTWPKQFPIIIIIPSIATLGMCLQHILGILKEIWKLINQLVYCVFGFPVNLFKNPFTSGLRYYNNASILLSIAVAFVILPLYSFALAFVLLTVESYLKRNVTPFQTLLASYVIFVITALAVYVIWMLFLRGLIRPAWAFTARRKYHKMRKKLFR